MAKYVIARGSAGGIGAAEAIREVNPVGTLVVVSEEPVPGISSIKYFDLSIIAVGTVNTEDSSNYELLVELKPEKIVYKKILLKDGKPVGFIFLGDLERAGILFRLLQDRIGVREIKDSFLSEDFGIVTLPEQLRQEMFVVN